jgi:hypothetical protein
LAGQTASIFLLLLSSVSITLFGMDFDKFLSDLDILYQEAQEKAATAPFHPCDSHKPDERTFYGSHNTYPYLNGFQDGVAAVKSMLYKRLAKND